MFDLPSFTFTFAFIFFFMHDDADKRVVLGSEKPCESVATSLRFPSQPGTFIPDHYGTEAGSPDGQPESPIKTSPVSERIKALEALAAKQKEPDIRSDGGFSQVRDRHYEKSPTDAKRVLFEAQKFPFETQKFTTVIRKIPSEIPNSLTDKYAAEPQNTLIGKSTQDLPKKGGSTDLESPESPFEVLGDLRNVNDVEETEEWMKAHLPPIPNFDTVNVTKVAKTSEFFATKEAKEVVSPVSDTVTAGVPDAFLDSPVKTAQVNDNLDIAQKQLSVEEESEFDLSFLPTAYVWDQQEKTDAQFRTNLDSEVLASPASHVGLDHPLSDYPPTGISTEQQVVEDKTSVTREHEPPEGSEMDSSGESDDTVIEDGVIHPASVTTASFEPEVSKDLASASAGSDFSTEEKVIIPPKSERKLMQVPTINVIETDEPNYSEEEMDIECEEEIEDFQVLKDSSTEAPKTPEPEDSKNRPTKTQQVEPEMGEGYSPSSSPVDSDAEYSPKHDKPKYLQEASNQENTCQPEVSQSQTVLKETTSDFSQTVSDKSNTLSNRFIDKPSPFTDPDEEVDFSDGDDDWSDEGETVQVASSRTNFSSIQPVSCTKNNIGESTFMTTKGTSVETVSRSDTSFVQGDVYSKLTQSFDSDNDATATLDDPIIYDSSKTQHEAQNISSVETSLTNDSLENPYLVNLTSRSDGETLIFKEDSNRSVINRQGNEETFDALAPEKTFEAMATEPEEPGSEDSFVEFMRECLKSRQEEEPDHRHQNVLSEAKISEKPLAISQSPLTMIMDLEQEQLTINALKELGSSQEEDDVPSLHTAIPEENNPNVPRVKKSTTSSVPTPKCSPKGHESGSMNSKEMETIDEWVDEAYHLAEHVLTTILTHISGNITFYRSVDLTHVNTSVTYFLFVCLFQMLPITVFSVLLCFSLFIDLGI